MPKASRVAIAVVGVALAGIAVWRANERAVSEVQTIYRVPRTAHGTPDLNGIWQAVGTAHWDVRSHSAAPGSVLALGAIGATPAGRGVVDGEEIPYQPWAAAKQRENYEKRLTLDPAIKCYLPGVPRATYMPHPFQIVQTPSQVLVAYEFAAATRVIDLNSTEESPADAWMGWSRGRWSGDTLEVDVTGFNDQTWFDRAGNLHSSALHVVERYTRTGPDHMLYEARIEDPQVFTRPWTIRMPLYRRVEQDAQIIPFKCVPFVEDLMYGHLRKKDGA